MLALPDFSKLVGCTLPLPPKQIHKAMLSLKDGHLRLCGGRTKGLAAVTSCVLYEQGGKWAPTFPLTHSRYSSTITPLMDGSLWMAGGISTKSGFTAAIDSSEVLTDKGENLDTLKPF